MASKSIFVCVIILLAVLCLLLMREPSGLDCSTGCLNAKAAGLKEIRNRKVLSALKNEQTSSKARLQGSSSSKYVEKSLSWELRKVPSGPDPLHHNGSSPKKPRTP